MAVVTSAVVGTVGTIAGIKSSRDQAKAQQQAIDQATTTTPDIGFSGPGGFTSGSLQQPTTTTFPTGGLFGGFDFGSLLGGDFGSTFGLPPELSGFGGLFQPTFPTFPTQQQPSFGGNDGNIGFDVGDLEGTRSALVGAAEGAAQRAGEFGLPESIRQAGNNVFDALSLAPGSNLGPIDALSRNAQRLAGTSAEGASNILGQLGSTFDERFQSTLGNLRDLARPEEDRAFNRLQNRQFATGQAGTTGGGIQTEAFARGLAQADTSRQLQALGEARAARASDLSTGTGLANLFRQQGGFGSDLNNLAFNRQLGLSELGVNRALQGLQTTTQLNQLPRTFQGLDLTNALNALQGQQGIFGQGLDTLQATLNRAIAEQNAQIGAGSNLANIVTSSNFQANPTAQLISDLAGSGTLQQGISALGGLFGGGGTNTSSVGNPGFSVPFPE